MCAWQPNPPYPGQQDAQNPYFSGGPPTGYPGAPGYPPQQGGFAPPGFPPQGGGGFPPQGGYPNVMPIHGGGFPEGQGYPGAPPPGYPQSAGFAPPPSVPYGHVPGVPKPFSPPPGQYGSGYPEDGGEGAANFDFSDQSIRRAFIRKVYMILMCQLLVTLGFIAVFTYHEPTKRYVHSHRALLWVAFGVMLVSLIAISCCVNVRRKFPMNFIFLSIFTLAESFILGVTSSTYQTDAVLMAVGLTAAICLGLTLFAFQTKWDFTVCGGGLFVAALLLMIFGIVAIFIPGKTVTLIYASLGALIFSLYLIYDTQMMMGGKHKYSISPEEYIFAALNLYVDIVNIFMYILTIIGASRD